MPVVDNQRTNELIDAVLKAEAELQRAEADLAAEIARYEKQRAAAPRGQPGVRAALTRAITHLERRQKRYVRGTYNPATGA